jgi:hypothetical protein
MLTLLPLGGCSVLKSAPPAVVSVTATDQVDAKTMAPVRAVDTFPKDVKLIYASALVTNPVKGTRVEARWGYDKEGTGSFVPVDDKSVDFPAASKQNYVAFSLKPVTTFFPGTYKVEILLDGKTTKELTFKVAG